MTLEDFCSENCPYLRKTPDTDLRRLPFYCDLFRLFLAKQGEHIRRCEQCIGITLNASQEGFNLISSYPDPSIDKRKTKWGFHRLPPEAKDRFVRLVKQSGVTMGVDNEMPLSTPKMLKSLSTQMEDLSVRAPEFETEKKEAFTTILKKLNEEHPDLINEATKDMLTNLYLSLDASEQDMMQTILASPGRAESLVKNVKEMPSNDHMVKDLRRTLDEIQKQMELEERQREQENRRLIQMALERQAEQQRKAEEQRRQEEARRQMMKVAEENQRQQEQQRQEQERQEQERQEQQRLEQEREREEKERKEREENQQRQERQKEQESAIKGTMENAAENGKQMESMKLQAIHANMGQGR